MGRAKHSVGYLAPTTWDFVDNLDYIFQDSYNKLFNAVAPRTSWLKWTVDSGYPKMDIYYDDTKAYIEAAVPGMERDEISIEVDHRNGRKYLVIKGQKARRVESRQAENYIHKELHMSNWSRSVDISSVREDSSISSTLKDGILKVEIPLPSEMKVENRKIEIR